MLFSFLFLITWYARDLVRTWSLTPLGLIPLFPVRFSQSPPSLFAPALPNSSAASFPSSLLCSFTHTRAVCAVLSLSSDVASLNRFVFALSIHPLSSFVSRFLVSKSIVIQESFLIHMGMVLSICLNASITDTSSPDWLDWLMFFGSHIARSSDLCGCPLILGHPWGSAYMICQYTLPVFGCPNWDNHCHFYVKFCT
jgi:hypothetical protein